MCVCSELLYYGMYLIDIELVLNLGRKLIYLNFFDDISYHV